MELFPLELENIEANIWLAGIEFVLLIDNVGVMLLGGNIEFDVDDNDVVSWEIVGVLEMEVVPLLLLISCVFKSMLFVALNFFERLETLWFSVLASFVLVLMFDKFVFELLWWWWFPTTVESLARSGIDEIKLSWLLKVAEVDIDDCDVETEFKSDESDTDLTILDGVEVREPLAVVFCFAEFVGVVEVVELFDGDFDLF